MSVVDRLLVHDEVLRSIARVVESGADVHQGASRIARAYPRCGLTTEQIANKIILAAARARTGSGLRKPEAMPALLVDGKKKPTAESARIAEPINAARTTAKPW